MKLISVILTVVILSSCKREVSGCETWEVLDECQSKNSYTACITTMPEQVQVCAGRLKDAKAGKSTVLAETVDARLVRHYIKRVK